jgi:hypothetical protein
MTAPSVADATTPRTDAPELVASALSVEVENDLRKIYSRSRTIDEVTHEIGSFRRIVQTAIGRATRW